jgi:hypothetical protein
MYKVVFFNQGKVYELFAGKVDSAHLYGFVVASDLQFMESGVVVDPVEERMREEFRDTEDLLLPMQSIVRIEKVRKRGTSVIRDRSSGEKVTPLPLDGPGRRR